MNVYEILIAIVCVVIVGATTLRFMSFNEWLLWVVTQAERTFGDGTGELKLRYAYGVAIGKFPWIATLIPFSLFKKLIDIALDKMEELIKNNKAIRNAITGKD